jgi:hypothetical protein
VYEPIIVPPTPRRGRTALIVAAAVVAVCCGIGGVTSLLSWAGRHRNATTDTGHAVVEDASAAGGGGGAAKPAATPKAPGIGTSVRDGVFEFTVLSLSCGHNEIVNGWLRATPQGQFCLGELRVTNIGGSPQRFADGNQKAYGPDGKTYAADTGAGVVANGNGDAIWNVVNPGNSLTAKVVFDLPPGGTIVWLEVHDSAFSRGVKVWVGA